MVNCDISVRISDVYALQGLRDQLEANQVAQRAMSSAPALTYIQLSIYIHSFHESCWAVVRDGNKKDLRKVRSEAEISRINRMFLPPQIQVSSVLS